MTSEMWKDDDLYDRATMLHCLKERWCLVTFTKVNGDRRIMRCTLRAKDLPEQMTFEEVAERDNPNAITVFDLDLQEWRSFRASSVTNFHILED